MQYIVLDLEWNQSPRGKAGKRAGIPFEILEIGAVRLDESFRLEGEFHEMIRPTVYRQLHYKTKEILQIDMRELKKARTFKEVAPDFFRWCGTDYIMCTWGSMDLTELQRNLSYFKIRDPFPKPLYYYDIQKLFSLLYEDGKERKALKDAVEYLKIEEDIPFHRALDDTLYTARIMQKMDMEKVRQYVSVDYFRVPRTKEEEIHLTFDRYGKDVFRLCSSREEAMGDKEICSTRCYRCGRTLRKKIRWFPTNAKTWMSLAVCPEHGYLKSKIRIKKAENGGIYVVKTRKLISPEDAAVLREKKLELQKRKKEKKNQAENEDVR